MRGSFHGSSGWEMLHLRFWHKPCNLAYISGKCTPLWVFWISLQALGQRPWLVTTYNFKGPEGHIFIFISHFSFSWNVWHLDLVWMKIFKYGLLSVGHSNTTRSSQNKFIFYEEPLLASIKIKLKWKFSFKPFVVNETSFLVPLVIKSIKVTFQLRWWSKNISALFYLSYPLTPPLVPPPFPSSTYIFES